METTTQDEIVLKRQSHDCCNLSDMQQFKTQLRRLNTYTNNECLKSENVVQNKEDLDTIYFIYLVTLLY